ncbi:MAG: TspO/MBR family protein [Planctomycetaceae bacterium]
MSSQTADGSMDSGRRWNVLVGFMLLSFAAAAIGSQFSPGEWYRSLQRPDLAPPNWVFGPVWTVLYLMMAVSGWVMWISSTGTARRLCTAVFVAQLCLNAAWSALFFGLHRPDWAFFEIVVLWLAIVATIVLFRRESTAAAWLLVPYLAWVSFAAFLNYGFWTLN